MHEYSLVENIIESIHRQIKNKPLSADETIKAVSLKIGALDIHSKESFLQAFEMLIKDTSLKDCELQLQIERGTLKCRRCGYDGSCPEDQGDGHDPLPMAECPRCGKINPIIGGRGILTMELLTTSHKPSKTGIN